MRSVIGDIGHIGIILTFVFSILGIIDVLSSKKNIDSIQPGRLFPLVSLFGSLLAFGSLFIIISQHYFEYNYAWSHSSKELDPKYQIACFWEGQEGSFLLWLLWNGLISVYFLVKRNWFALAFILSIQAFLSSMIMGVAIGSFNFGSSPFILLRDALPDLPVFKINPAYLPDNGRGLNPLLQNYWMVIHPPTVFLGFALSAIPVGLCLEKIYGIKKAVNLNVQKLWMLISTIVLGIGIVMGAYWAYETLNFNGYWSWDPVENAVFIPWLIQIAALHCLLIADKKPQYYAYFQIFAVVSFLLVLYSTFLTRSGILGETSVHSFTDLGLSAQLLLFLLTYIIGFTVLLIGEGRKVASSTQTDGVGNSNFWIMAGVTILVLASFQVLVTTSIPVYNAIGKSLGFDLKLAPPTNPIAHYTNWQMAFTTLLLIGTGIAQTLWWRKSKFVRSSLIWNSVIGAAVLCTLLFVSSIVVEWQYLLFMFAIAFAIIANGLLFKQVIAINPSKTGGHLTHLGLGVMCLGILFSSAYDKVISLNTSGLVYRKEFSTEMNRDNILLWRRKPQLMGRYEVAYNGPRLELENGDLINSDSLMILDDGRTVYTGQMALNEVNSGDTLKLKSENTYFEISYTDTLTKKQFSLFPRAQANPSMGLLASPDIKLGIWSDLYTHVSSIPAADQEPEWSAPEEHTLAIGDTFFTNDFVARLKGVHQVRNQNLLKSLNPDAAIEAEIEVLGSDQVYVSHPIFIIKGQEVGKLTDINRDLGIRFAIEHVNHENGKFTISSSTTQRDWVIMKAVQKPLISLVWGGFILMVVGFGVAISEKLKTKKVADNKVSNQRKRVTAKV